MSQMNNTTSKNLFDFATFFKKSLIFQLIAILVTIVGTFVLASAFAFGEMSEETLNGILLIFVGALGIATLIFQILMLGALGKAKLSSSHSELDKGYLFFMISVVLTGIGILVSIVDVFFLLFQGTDMNILTIISSVLTLGSYICLIISWKGLGNYIAVYATEVPPSMGFQMEAKGLNTYMITLYIVVVADAITVIVSNVELAPPEGTISTSPVDLIVSAIVFVSGIAAIVGYVAQFKIANGMLQIFGSVPGAPVQPSYVPPAAYTPAPTPAPSTGTDRFCIKCGAKIATDAHFCPNCGESFQ